MKRYEFIGSKAEEKHHYTETETGFAEGWNGIINLEHSAFRNGAEMMLEHMGKFAVWVRNSGFGYHPVKDNWKLEHMKTTYTTEQLVEEYFSTLLNRSGGSVK